MHCIWVFYRMKKVLDLIHPDRPDPPPGPPRPPVPTNPSAATLITTGPAQEAKGMEPKQEEKRKPSRAELERLALRLSEQLQGKLKGHKDGDAEEFLFKSYRRTRS
jgi:hypothetical protein